MFITSSDYQGSPLHLKNFFYVDFTYVIDKLGVRPSDTYYECVSPFLKFESQDELSKFCILQFWLADSGKSDHKTFLIVGYYQEFERSNFTDVEI